MSDLDKQLLVEFLSENFELFQDFLSRQEIEDTEAEVILDELRFC